MACDDRRIDFADQADRVAMVPHPVMPPPEWSGMAEFPGQERAADLEQGQDLAVERPPRAGQIETDRLRRIAQTFQGPGQMPPGHGMAERRAVPGTQPDAPE